VGKVRWEASKGVIFKTDETFTPSAVAARWAEVNDYTTSPRYPANLKEDQLKNASALDQKHMPPNPQGPSVDYTGQVVVVTGAGNGIGKAHALWYAKLGASVVVNDMAKARVDEVVAEIRKGESPLSCASSLFELLNLYSGRQSSTQLFFGREWPRCD
jgi:multifunctional beta-oxidation protein